ncbi:MAG: hypothetical protein JSS82_09565 [Bacteroidetes bacterium]|nr:hypothetical protein [Bacteroidota bacterium]
MRPVLALAIVSLLIFSCNQAANKERPSAQYENKKASLADMERENPMKFLKVNGDSHVNLINKEVVEGTISNQATLAAFKDIEVRVIFKDKGGSVIEKDTRVVNDVVRPNATVDFKLKMKKPKGVASVTLDITGAVAEK